MIWIFLALSSFLVSGVSIPKHARKNVKMSIRVMYGDSYDTATVKKKPMFTQMIGGSSSQLQLINKDTFYQTRIRVGSNRASSMVMVTPEPTELWVMEGDVTCNYSPNTAVLPFGAFVVHDPNLIASSVEANTVNKPAKPNYCRWFGTFNVAKSKTFRYKKPESDFYAECYGSEYAIGDAGTDLVDFSGGSSRVRVPLGVVSETSGLMGALGFGLPPRENGSDGEVSDLGYTNFADQLTKSHVINKSMFSIFFGKKKLRSGTILFGAVDHKKYKGRLKTVPIISNSKYHNLIEKPTVVVNHIYLVSKGQKVVLLDQPIAAVFDSSIAFAELPLSVIMTLTKSLNAKYVWERSKFQVDCKYTEKGSFMVFDFSGIRIRIPLRNLFVRARGSCYLAATTSDTDVHFPFVALGHNFLRHLYVAYDYEKMEISMAQVNYSNEEEIEDVVGSIPRAIQAPYYPSTGLSAQLVLHGGETLEVELEGTKKQ